MGILKRIKNIFKSKQKYKTEEEDINYFENKLNEITQQLFQLKKFKRDLLLKKEVKVLDNSKILSNIKSINEKSIETRNLYSKYKENTEIISGIDNEIEKIQETELDIESKINSINQILVKIRVQNAINNIKEDNQELLKGINVSGLEDKINYKKNYLEAYESLSKKDLVNIDNGISDDELDDFLKKIK